MNGIESSKLKVKRAREHIEALESCAAGYTSNELNLVVDESEGAKKLRFPNTPPSEIAILAGEIVYQLRSALDHLAFELVKRNPSGAMLPRRWEEKCYFPLCLEVPILGNPPACSSLPLPYGFFRSLPRITPEAHTVIEQLQPYNGGNGPTQLGWLEKLANVDKHRHFHVVIPQAYQTEHIRSAILDSEDIQRLQDGAEIKFPLHRPEELLDAVYVNRGIVSPFISFDETALPKELADIPIDNVLELCVDTVESNVIPKIIKLL